MDIKLKLLSRYIAELVVSRLDNLNIDADEIADSTAIEIVYKIQQVLLNEDYDDFEIVDEIVDIFYKYNLDTGSVHDFRLINIKSPQISQKAFPRGLPLIQFNVRKRNGVAQIFGISCFDNVNQSAECVKACHH
ncbi:MAG: hypothetical protein Q4G33_12915 [bacterium]|nr:hypothetical protein [bacterium]